MLFVGVVLADKAAAFPAEQVRDLLAPLAPAGHDRHGLVIVDLVIFEEYLPGIDGGSLAMQHGRRKWTCYINLFYHGLKIKTYIYDAKNLNADASVAQW